MCRHVDWRVIPVRKNITYETAIKRLEEIVTSLESGELPLDKSLKLYEEATELSAFCKKYLDDAEGKLTILSKSEIAEVDEDE